MKLEHCYSPLAAPQNHLLRRGGISSIQASSFPPKLTPDKVPDIAYWRKNETTYVDGRHIYPNGLDVVSWQGE